MKGILFSWLMLTVAIILASYLIDGIQVQSFFSAFFAAAVLGILNAFFRPVLILLTLPINILSFGLFTLVINAMLLKMASSVIPGFDVHGFWTAVLGSLVMSIVNWILSSLISPQRRIGHIDMENEAEDSWE